MKPPRKLVLASVNLSFSAWSSPSLTRILSFLLRMSSSFAWQYDTADSREGKISSRCWRVFLRTSECVRISFRMQRVAINLWHLVCISRLQAVASSFLMKWISKGASWSLQSDWKSLPSSTVASYCNTFLSISCSWAGSSDGRKNRHLLLLPGMHQTRMNIRAEIWLRWSIWWPIVLGILYRSHQTSL